MRVIGFNYTKISAERTVEPGKIEKVTQNLEFTSVDKDEIDLIKESSIIRVSFAFSLNYEPNKGKIQLEGTILLNTDSEKAKQILKNWKKKQIGEQLRVLLIKLVMNKCALKALNLEEELNLPPHIKLVQIRTEN